MISQVFLEATPWSGVWLGALSAVFILGLVTDAVEGYLSNELWFPCRFWSINKVFILLIIFHCLSPMYTLTDITSEITGYNLNLAKVVNIMFLFTMLAHYLPSLGVMSNQELFDNMMNGFGVWISWFLFFFLVQTSSPSDIPSFVVIFIIFILLLPLSVALTVPALRSTYRNKLRRLPSNVLMEETEHLQFLIVLSPVFSVCGVICFFFAICTLSILYCLGVGPILRDITSYKVIILVQSSGIVLGSITMMFRCTLTATILAKRCSLKSQLLRVFKVEKHWTKMLQEQKRYGVYSRVLAQPYRLKYIKRVVKNMLWNLCIGYQLTTVVICQIISVGPILIAICCLGVVDEVNNGEKYAVE